MMTSSLHRLRRSNDGFIIVAVMWILMSLAALASIYSIYVANSAVALSVNDDRIYTEAIVSAAIELTAYQLSSPEKQKRPTHGAFNFRLGRANAAVDFSSEASRIDLNAAPKELLAGLFAVLGAPNQQVNAYADRIIGWRTPPKRDALDSEDALYRASGLRYSPRGAPFAHVNELWLVQGLPPALVERAMAYATVFSGKPSVNVLDAAPEVIAALPGMTPGRLNAFLGQRESLPADPQLIAGALGGQAGISTEGTDAIRVNVRVNFDKGQQTASEVVILLGADDAPLRVLSWRDDVDVASTRGPSSRELR
jgi:general secretion pathway protein K